MQWKACLWLLPLTASAGICQPSTPPPPPPGPPRFMSMRGLPLACFDKPNFEEDGLEFFVCNGVAGISGVRKKDDRAHMVIVRDPEIAQNLNMQAAKASCGSGKRFAVRGDSDGEFSFLCEGARINLNDRFKTGSKAEWKKYDTYLHK